MAIVRLNPSIEWFRGKQGNQLYRFYRPKLVISPLPDYSSRPRSERQKNSSMKFAKAGAYADAVLGGYPVLRAEYARRKPRKYKTVRGFIIAEYMHLDQPPLPLKEQSVPLADESNSAPPAQQLLPL